MPRRHSFYTPGVRGAAQVSAGGWSAVAMTINDPQLKVHVEQAVGLAAGLPEDVRPICRLLDGYHWFSRVRGDDSAQAREALALLLSPELRPALRQWYQRCGSEMNPAALEFRQRLSDLASERLA